MNQICYIFIFRTRLKNSWTFGIYLAEHPKTDSGYGCSFVCVIFYILVYFLLKEKFTASLLLKTPLRLLPHFNLLFRILFMQAIYTIHVLNFLLKWPTNPSFLYNLWINKVYFRHMFDFSFCLRRKILLHLFSLHFFLSRINTSTSILHPNNQFFTKLVLVWDILNYHKVFSLFHRFPFPIL